MLMAASLPPAGPPSGNPPELVTHDQAKNIRRIDEEKAAIINRILCDTLFHRILSQNPSRLPELHNVERLEKYDNSTLTTLIIYLECTSIDIRIKTQFRISHDNAFQVLQLAKEFGVEYLEGEARLFLYENLTVDTLPATLLRGDPLLILPCLNLAWKPTTNISAVIRAITTLNNNKASTAATMLVHVGILKSLGFTANYDGWKFVVTKAIGQIDTPSIFESNPAALVSLHALSSFVGINLHLDFSKIDKSLTALHQKKVQLSNLIMAKAPHIKIY